MSSLALTFTVCILEKRHPSMQFMLLSEDQIQNLAQELMIEQSDTLEQLTKNFLAKHHNDNHYYTTFASLGSIEWTQEMIDRGATSHAWAADKAASNGHIEVLKLIGKTYSGSFQYAAVIAARKGLVDIVKMLVDENLVTLEGNKRMELLYMAVCCKHIDMIRYLLSDIVPETDRSFGAQICYRRAVQDGNSEIIELLEPFVE